MEFTGSATVHVLPAVAKNLAFDNDQISWRQFVRVSQLFVANPSRWRQSFHQPPIVF